MPKASEKDRRGSTDASKDEETTSPSSPRKKSVQTASSKPEGQLPAGLSDTVLLRYLLLPYLRFVVVGLRSSSQLHRYIMDFPFLAESVITSTMSAWPRETVISVAHHHL